MTYKMDSIPRIPTKRG